MTGGAGPAFEFQLPGPALSAQAKNPARLAAWKARVAEAARAAWPLAQPMLMGELEVHISEFSERATRDRDNLAKPICDAMQGIAYANDSQIKRLRVEWCDIDGRYVVRHMSPVVAAALSLGREFLWVRVWRYAPRTDLVR